jgi:hypothetical protein
MMPQGMYMDLEAIRTRDKAVEDYMIAGDKSIPWKRVCIDRRELLAHIDTLTRLMQRCMEQIGTSSKLHQQCSAQITAGEAKPGCPCRDCMVVRSQSSGEVKP